MSTWWGNCKNMQKKESWWLFEIIHIIHFEMLLDRPDKYLKKIELHQFYLSITFTNICHGWFPSRKASKLTFVCFQLKSFSPCLYCMKLFFLHIFAIPSSSRHEKPCWMLVRLLCLFQCSRNPQCARNNKLLVRDFFLCSPWFLPRTNYRIIP